MGKIKEAQAILKALVLPDAQQNEMSALTLLALCNITEDGNWEDASRESMGVSKGIMSFVNERFLKFMFSGTSAFASFA